MATVLKYTTEQLNYYRICYVVTDILTEGLRTIFKQEWDNRYKTTLGEWKDQPKNGMDFWNGESTRNRKRNAGLLTTMKNGDRAEWDCTMLFYAILYSDCIYSLNPSIRSNVDDFRKFRNEEFAHMPRGHLSNGDFQTVITKVKTAFHALGLPSLKINEVQNQTNFLTEELNEVLRKVVDLKQEVKDKEEELQVKEEQRLALEEQLNSDVSPFCILPPKPSHDIARRESEVDEVLQNLQTLKDANDGLSILYLSGNPGSGKSQLARLAARRFYDEVEQIPSAASFVMTLNAENSEALLKSYVLLAQHCKCPGYEITNTYRSQDLNTDEKISYFKTLISTKIEHYASWLLVVDNVTSESRTIDYLPDADSELWARGQMLITTQDTASIPLSSSSIQNISISAGMHPDDACFLLNLLSGISDAKMEKEIAKELDYQPLSLAAAATYVRQVRQNKGTSKFGWTDYLKKLEEGKRSNTESILATTNPAYPKTMTKAITLAVEMVMENDIILHHMFLFLSMCASQPILQDIIIEYVKTTDDEFEDEDMIRTRMSRCSLLLIEEESTGVYIRVHGVVLDVIKSATKGFAKDQSHKVVYGAVMSFSKFEELESIVVGTRIVPHLKTLSLKIEDMSLGKGIPEATERASCNFPDGLRSLNDMCQNHSEFRAALVYGEWMLKIQTKKLGPDHVDVASSYNNLGTLHKALGDTDEAKDFYKRALEIQMKQVGPEHVDVASSYNNLGILHSDLGDTDEAKDCYKRALEIQMKELGPEHVDVAISYNNLGSLHKALGDTDEAKDCYKRALEIQMKELGTEHVDVARSYNNLGTLHSALGDTDEAKDCYKRALEILLKKLGAEHVDVARCYNNLGTLHSALGDTDEAKDCYKRALEIRLKKLGAEHVDVARCYNNLGTLHSALGDTDEAKDCYKRALEIRLKKLGAEHVHVASCYNNLGTLHKALGDTDEAKDCYKRALEIRLKKLGAEHVHVAGCYNNLGNLHKALGNTDEAKDCYKRALEIGLKKLGAEHVDVARCYNNLGSLHSDLGDTDEAKDCYKRALEIRLKQLGPEHVDVASSYNNLGNLHKALNDTDEAKNCYKRALEIRLKKLGAEHVDVAACYNNLGTLHKALGDTDEAKDCYKRALEIRLKKLGAEHVDVARCYNNLGTLHSDLGDTDEAKDCYKRALETLLKKLGAEHVNVATSYKNLGDLHSALGDTDEAKDCYERALVIYISKYGKEHVRTLEVSRNLSRLK
ncbi:unnamed protein product [Pocillopora meandrina]|uniref:Nephrocystin-3 n=1 Tax=Pocillopora meandrina TaxID=46732 RepID=A0AAU9X4U2_9CNID|nr:unnamed protein product [Pocillopora meandrina]